jgi:hypothetical protein
MHVGQPVPARAQKVATAPSNIGRDYLLNSGYFNRRCGSSKRAYKASFFP